jgi:crotonobetainyl-CoA:carnitine CoA-transferase CaiB-like acyl-CoA transferase
MPVNSIEDVIGSRHLDDVGFFHTVEHPSEGTLRQMRPAATWSGTPLKPGRPAPNLGEHSGEVLREVGYSEDEVTSLIGRNVIRQWRP